MNETQQIKPALTGEEWAAIISPVWDDDQWDALPEAEKQSQRRSADIEYDGERPHARAALALHGHPHGFTWDDVDLLRKLAAEEQDKEGEGVLLVGQEPYHVELRDLADRLAALLPPREKP